ncbi:unnamed protein product [Boreogadus saida]
MGEGTRSRALRSVPAKDRGRRGERSRVGGAGWAEPWWAEPWWAEPWWAEPGGRSRVGGAVVGGAVVGGAGWAEPGLLYPSCTALPSLHRECQECFLFMSGTIEAQRTIQLPL